jgi:regulator of G-protein signaling
LNGISKKKSGQRSKKNLALHLAKSTEKKKMAANEEVSWAEMLASLAPEDIEDIESPSTKVVASGRTKKKRSSIFDVRLSSKKTAKAKKQSSQSNEHLHSNGSGNNIKQLRSMDDSAPLQPSTLKMSSNAVGLFGALTKDELQDGMLELAAANEEAERRHVKVEKRAQREREKVAERERRKAKKRVIDWDKQRERLLAMSAAVPSGASISQMFDGAAALNILIDDVSCGRAILRRFLVSELSVENLDFYEAVEEFAKVDPVTLVVEAVHIYKRFVHPDAPELINLPGSLALKYRELFANRANYSDINQWIFSPARDHVMHLVETDSLRRLAVVPACVHYFHLRAPHLSLVADTALYGLGSASPQPSLSVAAAVASSSSSLASRDGRSSSDASRSPPSVRLSVAAAAASKSIDDANADNIVNGSADKASDAAGGNGGNGQRTRSSSSVGSDRPTGRVSPSWGTPPTGTKKSGSVGVSRRRRPSAKPPELPASPLRSRRSNVGSSPRLGKSERRSTTSTTSSVEEEPHD